MSASAIRGFEDLPWGTQPDQIEAKFGEVVERNDEVCEDEIATAALAEQGEDCLSLSVDHYFANGIDFSASFRFDSVLGGLRMIVLRSGLKSKNLTPRAVKRAFLECKQNYEKLSRQLTSEFGAPLPASGVTGQPEPTFTQAEYMAWNTPSTGVWMRKSSGFTDHWKRWRKADGCEIEVRFFSIPGTGPISVR